MACVIGASFCGGGIGVAFSANGSTGGTDIIAAIINKYRDITLGRVVEKPETCRQFLNDGQKEGEGKYTKNSFDAKL